MSNFNSQQLSAQWFTHNLTVHTHNAKIPPKRMKACLKMVTITIKGLWSMTSPSRLGYKHLKQIMEEALLITGAKMCMGHPLPTLANLWWEKRKMSYMIGDEAPITWQQGTPLTKLPLLITRDLKIQQILQKNQKANPTCNACLLYCQISNLDTSQNTFQVSHWISFR
jgi:hypothetical protein